MYITVQRIKRKNGKIAEYLQMVESYREKGKVKKKVIANLGNKEVLQSQFHSLMKLLNPSLLKEEKAVEALSSASYGVIYLVHHLFSELGLWNLLDKNVRSKGFADRVAILVANRLSNPRSEHGLAGWLEQVYGCTRDGERMLPVWKQQRRVKVDLNWLQPFYRTLDGLISNKEEIELHLYHRLKDLFSLKVETVFYDLTSTYFEGNGPQDMAQYGYSRDGHPQNKQILVGVVMANDFPISHYIFRGNLIDHQSVQQVIEDVSRRFEIQRTIWVGDRGMLTTDNVDRLKKQGQGYLMGLVRRRREDVIAHIEAIKGAGRECKGGITQQEKKDSFKTYAWEVKGREEGVRVIVVHSEERAAYETAMREKCMVKVKKDLEALKKRVERGKIKKKERIGYCAGKILAKHKGTRYYAWNISGQQEFDYFEHPNLEREKKIEGKYLIQTEEKELGMEEAVKQYKELSEVERGFRSMKDVLELRPIFHRKAERVKAHIFVAALSLLLERIIERKLKKHSSLLSVRDTLDALATIGVVEFDVNGQKKRGVTAGTSRARAVLSALEIHKISLPEKSAENAICGHYKPPCS